MTAALVKIDVAAVDLDQSIARIELLADGSTPDESGLLWIFNLALNPTGRNRSLRFWRTELQARASGDGAGIRKLQLAQVISRILLPSRAIFTGVELEKLFQIRRPTRIDLHTELAGKIKRGEYIYQRAVLAAFLESRWLGNFGGSQ